MRPLSKTCKAFCILSVVLETSPVMAGSAGGLPWEAPLEQIQQSITGPVAGFIALAAVAVAGGMLIFGGELNDFARRLMYVVLVAGILLGASQIVSLFGATGATIAAVKSKGQDEDTPGSANPLVAGSSQTVREHPASSSWQGRAV